MSGAKRIFDVLAAGVGLVVLSPLLGVLAVLVGAVHGWPVIFSQERTGIGGKTFKIHKFRTMSQRKGADGQLLPDAERLTRLGRWMRATSLDEFPELVNVLKGEMSLVGPRPLVVRYLGRYSAEQMRRHAVLPGIAGWAQVNGRNAISWEEKFKLDVWYVEHWSFWLDMKILGMMVWKVLSRQGISQAGQATMEEFWGRGNDKGGA